MRHEMRARMEFIRRQRALARMGVRASGFVSLEHYKTGLRPPRYALIAPANDNPRPPLRFRINPSVLISIIAIALVACVLIWA
ncbi:MAG: hypothetical protein ACTHJ3_08985 [Pararhizobium sp.]